MQISQFSCGDDFLKKKKYECKHENIISLSPDYLNSNFFLSNFSPSLDFYFYFPFCDVARLFGIQMQMSTDSNKQDCIGAETQKRQLCPDATSLHPVPFLGDPHKYRYLFFFLATESRRINLDPYSASFVSAIRNSFLPGHFRYGIATRQRNSLNKVGAHLFELKSRVLRLDTIFLCCFCYLRINSSRSDWPRGGPESFIFQGIFV